MKIKYELSNKTKKFRGITLYRIRALKDFSDVKKGDLGGWVQSEKNLAKRGDCWIYDNAKVYEYARVNHDARICNKASVYSSTIVNDCVVIKDNAQVCGFMDINGNIEISGDMIITKDFDLVVYGLKEDFNSNSVLNIYMK